VPEFGVNSGRYPARLASSTRPKSPDAGSARNDNQTVCVGSLTCVNHTFLNQAERIGIRAALQSVRRTKAENALYLGGSESFRDRE
jgi:hypothetical protein